MLGWKGLSRRAGIDPIVLEKFGTVAAHRLAPAWPRIRRCASARQTFVLFFLCFVSWLVFLQLSIFSSEWTTPLAFIGVPGYGPSPKRMTSAYNTLPPLAAPIPCYGARGKLLSDSHDDRMEERRLNIRTGQPPEVLSQTQTMLTCGSQLIPPPSWAPTRE